MGRHCCVCKCAVTKGLYPFPRDKSAALAWIQAVGLQWCTSTNQKYVCKEHFSPESFNNLEMVKSGFATRLTLRKDAVPHSVDSPVSTDLRPIPRQSSGLGKRNRKTVATCMHSKRKSVSVAPTITVVPGVTVSPAVTVVPAIPVVPAVTMVPAIPVVPAVTMVPAVPVVPAVAMEGFLTSALVPKKNTTNNEDCNLVSSDEELDFCDQDSVAFSVDSSAEDMFIDDIDPILDCRPSSDLYLPEEDYDSKDAPQHRKRLCLSSAEGGDRKSENGFYWTETEKWQSSDEADVEPPLLVFTPNQNPGPQILPNRCSSALQFFQLLFPKSMFQTIAGYTNSYAAKYEERKGKLWNFISQSDMKSYVALVIYMGMFRCSSLSDYWSESQHFSLSFPAKIMSYRKFLSISKVLHLSESREDEKNILKKGTAGYERLGKIQPLYQVIRESCKSYFHPFQNITIVERMVKPQAGTGLKQSLKSRSPNMGFKLFALTDCTCGYTWDFFIYEGKSCASRSEGLSYESVMALVDENMLGSGYKLFVDKFYTSPTLFTDLLDKKVLACGPVWPNRTGYPKSAKNKLLSNAPRGTMRWIRQDKLLFVEWKDSKEVQMCSSFHKAYEGDTVQRKVRRDAHRTLEEIPVPAVVLDYSKNMEAVDSSDCITEHFRAIHKPKKWYQCMFYHFLDIAVENAFIMQELVTKGNGKKPLTRKAFLQALILELTDIDSLDSAAVPLSLSSSG